MNIWQNTAKRLFDVVFSFLGLSAFAVPMLVVAFLVRITSEGPLLFRQERVGRFGTRFTCVKFRTMAPESEQHGSVTTANDVRITSLGRMLRRLKFDELPQLLNVLLSKMSFVGPRPDVPGYADKLEGENREILTLRPGITCPASIYFRHEEEILAKVDNPKEYNDNVLWPIKVKMNREYLHNWSFWKDIGYICITILPSLNAWLKLVPESPRRPGEVGRT